MRPLEEMVRPMGRPVALKVSVAPDWESVAAICRLLMAAPETLDCVPGLVTATLLVMVQVKAVVPEYPAESVAFTVTELDPGVVGVPVMVPLVPLMESPAGKPVADHEVMVAVEDESVAPLVSGVMAVPVTFDWTLWATTVTVLVIFQVKLVVAVRVCESVAVTVTEQAQAVVGVPVMAPLEELIERPAGRPVAEKVTELPPVVSWGALMVRELMALPETFDWVPGLVTDRLSTFQVSVTEPAVPVASLPPPAAPVV
jgi:hypothetical protein